MGIYLFEPSVLVSLLMGTEKDDFGRNVIPDAIRKLAVYAYPFDGYWEDIGTIRAFYRANLALTDPEPPFDFYDHAMPIYTHPNFLAGARLIRCTMERAIVADGCSIQDARIERAVFGIRSVVGPKTRIRNTLMMGADFYETPADVARNAARGIPNVGVGAGADIDGAIIDKNARIGGGVTIRNQSGVVEGEGEGFYIREGIVIIPKDAMIPAGTVL